MHDLSVDNFADGLSVLIALLAVVPLAMGSIPRRTIAAFESIAQRRIFLLLLIPALSFTVNMLIAFKNGIPRVLVQDEHSYLLAADTFAHGRLTNPTPPFWEHFETPHELMQPTYMSKYPPGQGLALALGQALAGLPIVGIWLTTAAACAMIYWMLLGFVPPPWAMLGGFVAVLHPQLIQWSQNYWGGSVAILGGAMVLGGWVRLMSKPVLGPGVLLGIGLAILANSRPYEGLVFATPLMLGLIWQNRRQLLRIAIPLMLVLLPVAAAMGYFNFRITGHPMRMPFEEYARQYDIYPKFWFLPKQPQPAYSSTDIRDIHTIYEKGDYEILRTFPGFVQISVHRLWTLIVIHARPIVLLMPWLAALPTLKDKILRWVWLTVAAILIGLWAENFFLEHYAAPITAAMLLLIIVGWQRLGRVLAIAIAIGFFTGAIYRDAAPLDRDSKRVEQSALIASDPSLQTGKHLIFVQYSAGHLIHDEWVYNNADIDNCRIIWARFMGPTADAPVAAHFSGRKIWLLTVGENDLNLKPYALPH